MGGDNKDNVTIPFKPASMQIFVLNSAINRKNRELRAVRDNPEEDAPQKIADLEAEIAELRLRLNQISPQ